MMSFFDPQDTKEEIAVRFEKHGQFEETQPMDVTMDELFDWYAFANDPAHFSFGGKSSGTMDSLQHRIWKREARAASKAEPELVALQTSVNS